MHKKPAAAEKPPVAARRPAMWKLSAALLWFAAGFKVVISVVALIIAPDEVDTVVGKELYERSRISIYTVQALQPKDRVEYDQHREAAVFNLRLWHGCDLLAGGVMLVCAFLFARNPLVTTMSAMTAFALEAMIKARWQPFNELVLLVADFVALLALAGAVWAAIIVERRARREVAGEKTVTG